MLLFDNIDLTKKYEYIFVLTRKNKTPIAILGECYNRVLTRELEGIDTLTFTIPYYIVDSKSQRKTVNPNYNKIIPEEMIHLICKDGENIIYSSYFVIKSVAESLDGLNKKVTCKARRCSLNKNTITINGIERKIYDEEGTGVLNIFEQETSWKVKHVDESLLIDVLEFSTVPRYRWIDALSKPWLQFLQEDVQSAYNCIIMFDDETKEISVFDRDNFGNHTGLILSEKNYMRELEKTIQTENLVTKLRVSGQDEMTFADVNIYGTDWILNYDYFINNGQMSEELVHALERYNILLEREGIKFKNIRIQYNDISSSLITVESQLSILKQQLTAYLRIQSALISAGDNENLSLTTAEIANIQNQINEKQSIADSLSNQLKGLQQQMADIGNAIDKRYAKDVDTNNLIFNDNLLEELEDFTLEEFWQTDYYPTSELLLKASMEQLKEYAMPTIEFSVDLADFLKDINNQMFWDKLNLGDFVRTYSSKLNTNVDLRIIGYTHNIDDNQLKIDFSNKNKKLQKLSTVGDVIRKTTDASKYLNAKRLSWNETKGIKNAVDIFLNNALDLARQQVLGKAGNNKITITENGILVEDVTNSNNQIAILSGLIAITDDGWQTCSTAVDSTGVYADKLVGRILIGKNLFIQNEDSSFVVDEDGVRITNGDKIGLSNNPTIKSINTEIIATKESITLKADKTTVNALETRVASAEQKITADAIVNTVTSSSKYKGDLNALNGRIDATVERISTAEQKITAEAIVSTVRSSVQYNNDLNAKANQSDVSNLASRVTSAEQKITAEAIVSTVRSSVQYNNDLNAKANQSDVSNLASRVTSAEQKITAEAIVSTVRESNAYKNDLNSKASQSSVNSLESAITQTAQEISQKVSKGSIISEINQSAESVKISASKIEISGFVTFSDLSTSGKTVISADNISTGTIQSVSIGTATILGGTFMGTYVGTDDLYALDLTVTQSAYFSSSVSARSFNCSYTSYLGNVSCGDLTADYLGSRGSLAVLGHASINSLSVNGSKNALQQTKNYGSRLINAYETAEYYYGDLGFGKIGEDGELVIHIDEVFQECVNMNVEYHVFIQPYNGKITRIDKQVGYFIVYGEPYTEFSWELKAKRIGYENDRLETPSELYDYNYSNIENELDIPQVYSYIERELEENALFENFILM